MSTTFDHSRLAMPVGEAMFTQRSIRRLKPDPIPMDDLRADRRGGRQGAERRQFAARAPRWSPTARRSASSGRSTRMAWWAKRRDQGWKTFEDLPKDGSSYRNAAQLAEDIKDALPIVFAFGVGAAAAPSVVPGTQNLMLAARALGIGSCPTTLHPR